MTSVQIRGADGRVYSVDNGKAYNSSHHLQFQPNQKSIQNLDITLKQTVLFGSAHTFTSPSKLLSPALAAIKGSAHTIIGPYGG